jgi:hypothetical protein
VLAPKTKAFLGSFLVYLLPLVTAHAVFPLGVVIGFDLTGAGGEKEVLWIAADIAAALSLQVLAGFVLYWVFVAPSWKRVVVAAASVPALFVAGTFLYLLAIPTFFLVERDTAPEKTDLTEACVVPDYYLAAVRTSPYPRLAEAGEAWVADRDQKLALLRMPGCAVEPMGLNWSNVSPDIAQTTPGGRAVFSRAEPPAAERTWWYLPGPETSAIAIESRAEKEPAYPILSDDGQWVGWLSRNAIPKAESGAQVTIEAPASGEIRTIDIDPLPKGGLRLLALDTAAEEITFEYGYRSLLRIGFDGAVRWGPLQTSAVQASGYSMLLAGNGWVAWDSYKEQGSYVMQWTFGANGGTHRIPKGRSANAVAVSPSGRFIALSVDTNLNIGDIPDSVYVLRTSDGSEVFRRYLPTYSRSQVAFFGDGHFAYTEGGPSDVRVRVLKLPAS